MSTHYSRLILGFSSASRLLLILPSLILTLTSRNIKTTSRFSHGHFIPHSFLLRLFQVFLPPRGSPSIFTLELCSYERVRWGWHIISRVNCPGLPALWLSGSTGLMAVRGYRPYGCPAVPALWLSGSTGLTAVRQYRPCGCAAVPALWLCGSTGLTAVRQYRSRKHYKSDIPKQKEHLIHFKKHYIFSWACNRLRKYWV